LEANKFEVSSPEHKAIVSGAKPIPELVAYAKNTLINGNDKNPSDILNELLIKF
jgi:hypothetical protein